MALHTADMIAQLDALAPAFTAEPVALVCLFGSALERTEARDIDVAVLFHTYSFERYLDLLEMLCEALHTRRVDLVVLNRVNALLKVRTLLAGHLVYAATPTSWSTAVTAALRDYEDYGHFMAEYRHYLAARCQEGFSVAERRIDRERIEGYLSTLDEAMAHLQRLQRRFASFEEFHTDVDTRELCVHYLRIALEVVLDICRHVLAVVGLSLAELETTNLIDLAGTKGLLEPAFTRRIRGMAGMRNAIVHVYWRLDYEAIYRAVTEQLTDLDEFGRQVRRYLHQESEG